jgi:hypothetical protein
MDRTVKIRLGQLGLDGLAEKSVGSMHQIRSQAAYAIRYYLSDKGSERADWPYPKFLRDRDPSDARPAEIDLKIDSELWTALEEEARRQHVVPELLAQHAVLYFLADREAGRVAQRIRAA